MIWFPLSIGAAFFWSIAQILLKKGLENIPPLWGNIISNSLTLFLWLPTALLLSKGKLSPLNLSVAPAIFFAALFYLSFLYALSKGNVSLVGTIVAIYPVWTIILSGIFLGETINSLQKICIIMIIFGSILVSLPSEKTEGRKAKNNSWIFWGFLASVLIGAGDFLSKLSINKIGVYSYIFYLSLFSNAMSAINYGIDKKARNLPSKQFRVYRFTLAGTALSLTGSFLFQMAFQYGKASLVTPVSSTYPALTVALAIKFLGEKLTFRQMFAVGITVSALVLMGFSI